MTEHFIIKCEKCQRVIAQCRCISTDKKIRYEVCSDCQMSDVKRRIDGPNDTKSSNSPTKREINL